MDEVTYLIDDPETGSVTGIAYSPEGPMETRLLYTHRPTACADHYCAIHNRASIHRLSMEPLVWNQQYGCLERMCSHGQLHPDKDNLDYFNTIGGFPYDHDSCDGCCKE